MALFSRLKLKVQFALSKKVIISEARCRFTIEGRRGEGRHGLLEAACNDLPKLEDHREEWVSGRERVLAMMRVEFEVCFWKRMAFLEKRIFLTISV